MRPPYRRYAAIHQAETVSGGSTMSRNVQNTAVIWYVHVFYICIVSTSCRRCNGVNEYVGIFYIIYIISICINVKCKSTKLPPDVIVLQMWRDLKACYHGDAEVIKELVKVLVSRRCRWYWDMFVPLRPGLQTSYWRPRRDMAHQMKHEVAWSRMKSIWFRARKTV